MLAAARLAFAWARSVGVAFCGGRLVGTVVGGVVGEIAMSVRVFRRVHFRLHQ